MRLLLGIVIISAMFIGCASSPAHKAPAAAATRTAQPAASERQAQAPAAMDHGWTTKAITEQDLMQIYRKDLSLTPETCREILAKLNARAPYHISDDIRSQRPLKVPNDFAAYKGYAPLPPNAPPAMANHPKSILIVKDLPYIGWYERGVLKGDSYACVGRPGEATEAGLYRILEKDPDHVSRSYRNSYGKPAWMPWALRIYDHVWIHAGDVTGAYCSHGCIILPLDPAQDVYRWADLGTVVMVVDSLSDLSTPRRP